MGTGRSGHRSVRAGHRVTTEECVLNMLHCTGSTAPHHHPPAGSEINPTINSPTVVVCCLCLFCCCCHFFYLGLGNVSLFPWDKQTPEHEVWLWIGSLGISVKSTDWNTSFGACYDFLVTLFHFQKEDFFLFFFFFLRCTFPVYYRSAPFRQPDSRPSAPSGADMSAGVPLSLSLRCVMNWSVSCLIGNNNRNYKLRILPDCRISFWNIIYTVWECVISFVFQRWLFTYLYIQCFNRNCPIWMQIFFQN